MANIPVALQLHTVREQLEEDPVATIQEVAKIGYAGVEGGPRGDMSNSEWLDLLSDNGLQLIGGGANPAELRDNFQKVVDNSGELGVTYLMTGIGGELRKNDNDWKKVVGELAEGCAKAAEAGLKVLYHNHAFEFETKVDGQYGLDYLFDTIPAEHLGAELDVFWVYAGGEDPIAYINKYADRSPRLHLKDHAPSPDDETCRFAEVGHGILDWDGIFAAVEGTPIEWYAVEQDRWIRHPLECARMSFDYLKSRGMA